MSTLKDILSQTLQNKDVKVMAISNAITAATGIAPYVDTSNPNVTVIQTRPEHAQFVEALLDKKGPPSNVKIDFAPMAKPFLMKKIIPPATLIVLAALGAGIFIGMKLSD